MNALKMNEQLIVEDLASVQVEARGKSEEEAIGNAFQNARLKLNQVIDGYLVHLVPEEFEILRLEKESKTERFLFLFMPKEKVSYKIEARIKMKSRVIK